MTAALTPETQERLLDLASDLVTKLIDAPIYLVADDRKGEAAGLGVPASCVGHATSFLYNERNVDRFRFFVERLERLDAVTGQNLDHPRAQHAALKRILGPWLERHAGLSADECLYVLSWVRRLLPKVSKAAKPPQGRRTPRGEPPREDPQPPARGDQMGEAFARARAQAQRKKDRKRC
jgi:hypothetical protein